MIKSYSFESPPIQCFSIPSNVIYYINQNPASPECLQKLHKTCKWFFAKNKIIVIQNKYFHDNSELRPFVKTQIPLQTYNGKFWYTGTLTFNRWGMFGEAPATVWPKIYRCDITSLKLNFVSLNIREFELLTLPKNSIKTFHMSNGYIWADPQTDCSLDYLLSRVPSATVFRSVKFNDMPADMKPVITNDILKNMIQIKNDNSIENLETAVYILSPNLDPQLFCSFIKKAAAPKASFRFVLDYSFHEQKEQIKSAVTEMLSQWNDDQQKPFIGIADAYDNYSIYATAQITYTVINNVYNLVTTFSSTNPIVIAFYNLNNNGGGDSTLLCNVLPDNTLGLNCTINPLSGNAKLLHQMIIRDIRGLSPNIPIVFS